jgi:acyl-homoserine lactone acylase PvdQ
VDGSIPATEWQGLLNIDETPHLLNPQSGWLYNSNNAPWSDAADEVVLSRSRRSGLP